ncbi:MAG: aminotransferase class I/II-fold pyridoxal phosphate-dependent enzyme [Breoghania sp.]|nr:aminotransferase class I/II-fold pyridoxal phosphate-dependent enzyme [Breoghania sp.]
MLCTTGVVHTISAILRALTKPGDKVIVQTPVYNCFFSSIRNMECEAFENPLINRDGYFEMDFEDLERKAAEPDACVLLLCNPHNPVGRSWSEEELRRLGEICFRHDVTVISDEIHCDLVHPGHKHCAFAALGSEFNVRSITCNSASKTFNIAGLQLANIVIADPDLRARVDRALNVHEVSNVNPLGVEATIAAYNEGEPWLEELNAYVHENYLTVADFLAHELSHLHLIDQEATYLAWIDC